MGENPGVAVKGDKNQMERLWLTLEELQRSTAQVGEVADMTKIKNLAKNKIVEIKLCDKNVILFQGTVTGCSCYIFSLFWL